MKNKRTLPVNVDGRLKIGPFILKNFFKWVPIPILWFVIFIKHPGLTQLVIGIIIVGFTAIPFMEFKFKQTGWDFLKEIFTYDIPYFLAEFFPSMFKHRKISYERRVDNDSFIQKFTFNKKIHEYKKKRREKEVSQDI